MVFVDDAAELVFRVEEDGVALEMGFSQELIFLFVLINSSIQSEGGCDG